MELWIPITIAAAFLQNLRSAAQKHLKGVMGTTGATFVRFGFGFPFALLFVAILHFGAGLRRCRRRNADLLRSGRWSAALAQIAATFLLVHLFSFRNFAVGTAYSRTEPAQAALFGLIFLGETSEPRHARRDRHQRLRRHADLGGACGRQLAQRCWRRCQPQRR